MKKLKYIIAALFAVCLCSVTRAEDISVFPDIIDTQLGGYALIQDILQDPYRQPKPIFYDGNKTLRLQTDDERNLNLVPMVGVRPLTGPSCTVNKLIKTVGAGSWNKDMNAITDEDLTNYAEFNGVARVSAAHDPIVSIRDMGCYYSKGMTAGFCVVASSGSVALDLKLIKMMSLTFYRDGHAITDSNGAPITKLINQAQGEGVNLSLIQVPGSEDALAFLTAEAPDLFDEISLNVNGVDASVGNNIKVKYAFVGYNKEYTITGDLNDGDPRKEDVVKIKNGDGIGIYEYNQDVESPVVFSYAKSWDPVLLGIPFPHVSNSVRRMLDTDMGAGTGPSIQPILDIGYKGGAKFMMKRGQVDNNIGADDHNYYDIFTDAENNQYKVVNATNRASAYPAGTEVGFKYTFGQALTLDLGVWAMLRLYDWQETSPGKWEEVLVQETNINSTAIGLTVAAGGQQSASVTANVPFSGAEIRFYTVASVNVGAYSIDYAFVKRPIEGRHHCPIYPSLDTNLCGRNNGYFQLRSNPEVSVTWRLLGDCQPGVSSFKLPVYDENYNITGYRAATSADECWDALQNIKVTPAGRVSGLPNIDGLIVTFCAVAKDGCHEHVNVRIGGFGTRDLLEGVTPLVGEEYELGDITGGGALISISLGFDDEYPALNIVDSDLDKYAKYTKGTSIAGNVGIVGVKKKNGYIIDATTADSDTRSLYTADPKRGYMRVGFVVETVDGLDVKALEFLNISCVKNGVEVYKHVIEESNAINADIAGNQKAVKMRFSTLIPFWDKNGNAMQFDEIQLWTSGLLKLGGETLKIYYAFYEDGSNDVPNPLQGEYTMLAADIYQEDASTLPFDQVPEWMFGTHATINGEATTYGGAVDALTITDNLSFFIDDDPDTYTLVSNTVAVGTGLTIAVNTGRTLDNRHQLGIIIDDKTYLANVGVGGWLTVETFYNGVSTGEKFSDWKVVGANVAGGGDKRFMLFSPKLAYNEVRVTIAQGVAKVLDNMKLYGLFVRADADGDGVPDDVDVSSCSRTIPDIKVQSACQGDPVSVYVKGNSDMAGASLLLAFSDPSQLPHVVQAMTLRTPGDGQESYADLSYQYTSNKAGEYELSIYEVLNPDATDEASMALQPMLNITYYVHPNKTTWSASASDSEWNKWDNWTDGSPYLCTDVIIPAGLDRYPVLSYDVANITEYGTDTYLYTDYYGCDEIFFEHGANVGGIAALNYREANVDLSLDANQYYALSAPLKYMYTGDMFVPQNDYLSAEASYDYTNHVFNHDTQTAKRFNPIIYQRLYDQVAKSHKWNENSDEPSFVVGADDTFNAAQSGLSSVKWSRNFNSVSTPYNMGMGFSLWVDNDKLPEDSVFMFRFPKTSTNYLYYEDYYRDVAKDGKTNLNDDVARGNTGLNNNPYRFIYETDDNGVVYKKGDYDRKVYLKTFKKKPGQAEADNNVYHQITLTQDNNSNVFLFGNPYMSNIDLREFLSVNADISTVWFWHNSSFISATYDAATETFVSAYGNLVCIPPMTSVFLQTTGAASQTLTVNITPSMLEHMYVGGQPQILSREADEFAALRISVTDGKQGAGMVALANGDLENSLSSLMLFDSEVRPTLAVWGLNAQDEFCDILPFAEGMQLGIYAAKGANAALHFDGEGGFDLEGYELYDAKTGESYPLTQDVDIDATSTSVGRYMICRAGAKAQLERHVYLTQNGGQVTAHTNQGNVVAMHSYAIDGALEHASSTDTVTANYGVKVIVVTLDDNTTATFKVVVK